MLRRAAIVALAAALASTFALTGCSGSAASQIAYVVDGPLTSYNVNTTIGAATAGAQAPNPDRIRLPRPGRSGRR